MATSDLVESNVRFTQLFFAESSINEATTGSNAAAPGKRVAPS